MALRPLNDDKITVSQYRFKKQIELQQADIDILEHNLEEKTQVCQELIEENKKLVTQVKTLKTKMKKGK